MYCEETRQRVLMMTAITPERLLTHGASLGVVGIETPLPVIYKLSESYVSI